MTHPAFGKPSAVQQQGHTRNMATEADHSHRASDDVDHTAPVIIIGAGRSGTTLLSTLLGEHPDFYMIGETNFLLPRLWQTFYKDPAFVDYQRTHSLMQQTRDDWSAMPWYKFCTAVSPLGGEQYTKDVELLQERTRLSEEARTARELGAFIANALIPPSLRRQHWGIKEIWAGSDAFPYGWDLYRAAFPNARYLHCVRHPLRYLASNFNFKNLGGVSEDKITHELGQWLKMVRHARSLADQVPYLEFRYEDLIDGMTTVNQVFAFVGLDLTEKCLRTLSVSHVPSSGVHDFTDRSAYFINQVPGLWEEMRRLGYCA